MNQNKKTRNTIILIAILTSIAIASRFILIDWPNFKPIAAIALFLGFYCQDRRIAVLTILAVMLITDCFFGFYSTVLMMSVYSSIAIACGLGYFLNRWLRKSRSIIVRLGSVASAALVASVVFYLVTNITVALVSPWYPNSLDGVVASLAAGIPFFKYTLAGNVLFSLGIFSTYFAWNSAFADRPAEYAMGKPEIT